MLTIGHSTHAIEPFIDMLVAHQVELVCDVRTMPKSRRHPQFNADNLEASLRAHGIGYRHMPQLGGLRRPRKDSINSAWQNDNFRGYADYMQTPEFEAALSRLIDLARGRRLAMMCAEAVPWRCHRSLIADALAAGGIEVEHILSRTSRKAHEFTPFARVQGGRVTYPGVDQS